MGRQLVPATMLSAVTALAVAAVTAALVPLRPAWWQAAIALAVISGLVPMIFSVTIRVVPVFARRMWPSLPALRAKVVLVAAGGWLIWLGRLSGLDPLVALGSLLALAGGVTAVVNTKRLFKQPVGPAMAPPSDPMQSKVDAVARPFTRIAGIWLLVGLAVGVLTAFWRPPVGRWELVWAHALLLGYVFGTASGISYHVLSRWTGTAWRVVAPIRWHFWLWAVGLPVMVVALASGQSLLFAVAGPLQAAAVLLFIANTAPMVPTLPGPTRWAFAAASTLLAVGVVLGAWFALEPSLGARLQVAHVALNLFGWAALLVSGASTFLVPRFAGNPLRWPRLAFAQVAVLATGVVVAAVGTGWRMLGDGPALVVTLGFGLVALGFVMLATVLGGTFFAPRSGANIAVVPGRPPKMAT